MDLTDNGIKLLAGLSELEYLGIWGTKVTPAGMRTVAEKFPKLHSLVLGGTNAVDRDSVLQICRLRSLRWLDLGWTGVADEDLDVISQLPELRVLLLRKSKVTDAGLAKLVHCKSLKRVDAVDTQATEAGITLLKAALPDCQVDF